MIVNGYSIALLVCSLGSIFLVCAASKNALKVLFCWSFTSDTKAQIELESETWLAALLVQFGLFLQVISLFLLVMAADRFSGVLVGAMCAAGAFLANDYGLPALYLKIGGFFLCGYWLVLHRLDIRSEFFPLIRFKSGYLLFLIPLLFADLYLVVQYLIHLEPDVITSCCGVLFGNSSGGGYNLVGPIPLGTAVIAYLCLAAMLLVLSSMLLKKTGPLPAVVALTFAVLWLVFCAFSLLIITAVVSPYIYAMPSHRCPFDILKKEYHFIGFALYLMLFSLCFFASSAGFAEIFRSRPGLDGPVRNFRLQSLRFALVMLPLLLLTLCYHPFKYLWLGGEY